MPSALVTGAGGFLGRHFAARLRRDGWVVHGVDTRPAGDWMQCDARDFFRSAPAYYDLVIHAAAVVGGREVIEKIPLAQAVNLELDAALFGWAQWTRPGRIVYLSSSAVYPVDLQCGTGRFALTEGDVRLDAPQAPDALYGWTKLTGEYLAELARADGQAVTVVRPFSGYGPDQDLAYPFPAMIRRALDREDPFVIWGSGQQARDFIHVQDIVSATLAMTETGVSGPLNLGSGIPVTMRQLAQMVCDRAGYSPQFKPDLSAPAGVEYRVAETSQMAKVWVPQVPLADGISEALEYRR